MAHHHYAKAIKIEVDKYIEIMPRKKTEIIDLARLAYSEIQDGGSIDHEIELMVSSLDELHDQEYIA